MRRFVLFTFLVISFSYESPCRSDEPYAPSYDLETSDVSDVLSTESCLSVKSALTDSDSDYSNLISCSQSILKEMKALHRRLDEIDQALDTNLHREELESVQSNVTILNYNMEQLRRFTEQYLDR